MATQTSEKQRLLALSAKLANGRISSIRTLSKGGDGTLIRTGSSDVEAFSQAVNVKQEEAPLATAISQQKLSGSDFSDSKQRLQFNRPSNLPQQRASRRVIASPKKEEVQTAHQETNQSAKLAERKVDESTVLDSLLAADAKPSGGRLERPSREALTTTGHNAQLLSVGNTTGIKTDNIKLLLCGLLVILIGYAVAQLAVLGFGVLSDYAIARYMSSKHFIVDGDMRPWMRACNRHILRDIAEVRHALSDSTN